MRVHRVIFAFILTRWRPSWIWPELDVHNSSVSVGSYSAPACRIRRHSAKVSSLLRRGGVPNTEVKLAQRGVDWRSPNLGFRYLTPFRSDGGSELSVVKCGRKSRPNFTLFASIWWTATARSRRPPVKKVQQWSLRHSGIPMSGGLITCHMCRCCELRSPHNRPTKLTITDYVITNKVFEVFKPTPYAP